MHNKIFLHLYTHRRPHFSLTWSKYLCGVCTEFDSSEILGVGTKPSTQWTPIHVQLCLNWLFKCSVLSSLHGQMTHSLTFIWGHPCSLNQQFNNETGVIITAYHIHINLMFWVNANQDHEAKSWNRSNLLHHSVIANLFWIKLSSRNIVSSTRLFTICYLEYSMWAWRLGIGISRMLGSIFVAKLQHV